MCRTLVPRQLQYKMNPCVTDLLIYILSKVDLAKKTNHAMTWGCDISFIDHKMRQDTCRDSKKIWYMECTCGKGGGPRSRFRPQTHIRSFKHLTVHNNDVRINTIGVRPLLMVTFTLLIRFCMREIDQFYILCWMGGPIPSHRRFRLVQLAHGDGCDDVVPTEGSEKNPKARSLSPPRPSVQRGTDVDTC
jgi:hypothetical protein